MAKKYKFKKIGCGDFFRVRHQKKEDFNRNEVRTCAGRGDSEGGKVPKNVLQKSIGLKLHAKTLAQLKNPKNRYLVEKIEKMTQQIGRNKKETVLLHNLEDLCTTKRNRKRELVDKNGKQSK